MLKYKILVTTLVGVLAIGALGCITVTGTKVNGQTVFFKSEDEIKSELEKVEKTQVKVQNKEIDITSAFRAVADDFEKKFGDQVVNVSIETDEDKIFDLVKSNVELGEYEKIDRKALLKGVSYGETTDVNSCIVLKYPQEVIDKYEKLKKWSVSYKKDVSFDNTEKYLKISKKGVKIDYSFIDKIVEKVQKKYDTFLKPIKFKTHSGKKITIQSGWTTWYTKVDADKEKKFLKEQFDNGKSLKKRDPIWLAPWGHTQNYGDIPDTYVEVSISQQYVWFYKHGKVVMSSPCVSGNRGNHDTPHGVYYISEYLPQGKVLKGDGYATRVYKWMRLTGTGVGLHDAYWRGSFGGSIYTYNGSHGCINLPPSFASSLCSHVKYGTCVVVY